VTSEPCTPRTPPLPRTAAWSVITAAEILDGIAKAKRTGATRKAAELAAWWQELSHYWSSRILPIDLAVAGDIGRLLDVARAAGEAPGFEDIAIAATAAVHRLTVLTANEKHFRALGIAFANPLVALPSP